MITVTVNAFIHGRDPSVVRLSRGPFATQTAIPLPASAYAAPLNLGKLASHIDATGLSALGVGYLTDQRPFATRPNAPGQTQRMQSTLTIDASGAILARDHVASPTLEVDLSSGEMRSSRTANLKTLFGFFRLSQWQPGPPPSRAGLGDRDRRFAYRLEAEGSDPLVSMSWVRPIHYGGDLTVTLRAAEGVVDVAFEGYATHFPYFEGFVQVAHRTESLFKVAPEPGRDVASLLHGKQQGRLSGRVRLPMPVPAF